MTIIRKPVSLPLLAVDRLWEWAGLGKVHPALGIGDLWVPEDSRRKVENAVYEVLEQQGLGSPGNPSPEITGTLRLIATATEEYYAWINDIGTNDAGALLVAAKDDEAVLMSRDQRGMELQPIDPERLAERFVEAIVEVEAADIPNLSVPKAGFSAEGPVDAPANDDDGFGFSYESDQADDVDPAAKLRELLHAKRTAVLQMYTAKRAGGPSRKRVGPYAMIDIIGQGRVLTFVAEEGSEPVIKCLPGSKDNLVKALTEANAALG